MKCKSCKAELDPHNPICPDCGFDNSKKQSSNKNKILIIIAALVIGLVVGVMVALVSVGMNSDSGDTDGTDPSTEETISAEDQAFLDAMDDVVVTMGEHTMTNSMLQMYYWMSAYTYTEDADLTGDLSTQIHDEDTGETYEEYFLSIAYDAWKEIMVMADAARAAGYEMPEDYLSQFETMEDDLTLMAYYYYGLTSADELIQMQFGTGCTYDDYYSYVWDYYLGSLYWNEMLMELEVSDAEIDTYYADNEQTITYTKDSGDMVDIRNILILTVTAEETDDEGVVTSVEDWDATLAKAQEIYDLYLNGEQTEDAFAALAEEKSEDDNSASAGGLYESMYRGSMKEVDVRHILVKPEEDTEDAWAAALDEINAIQEEWLAGEATEDTFAKLANTYSDDNGGNVTNGGLYTDVYMGQMVENFENWCFDESRQTGDYGIVQTSYGYHLMYFVREDGELDDWVFDEARVDGDCAMIKTDYGYQIVYISGSEEAWIRYCRYGVQVDKAQAMLDELMAESTYTVDSEKIVLGGIG